MHMFLMLTASSRLNRRVTYNSLRKFKHLTISLSYMAVSDICQEAFDKSDFDNFPEV